MKRVVILLFLIVNIPIINFGQTTTYTQTIRGTIKDKDTGIPVTGITVIVNPEGTYEYVGQSDALGEFEIKNVPIGKYKINAFLLGYKSNTLTNVEVNSGRETYLNMMMEMSVIETEEVIITAGKGKNKPQNEMAVVSARSFNSNETERYAGSLGDPSRMAANFAGVMSVSDQRNDIIIRGNAPTGLLWRLDGIDIPNPNHFGALGTTGGPVSMLNNNLLTNSDFLTGAFPAEYGNAISGVFDLKMRNGNNKTREYVAQVGFNGFELGAEGPFTKNSNASYLINFRYSTMELINKMGINDGTGASVPQYKDLSFKLNFPLKKGRISLFGIGGISYIELLDKDTTESSYGVTGTNTYFGSDMGVAGLNYVQFINESTKLENNLAYTIANSYTKLDSLNKNRLAYPFYRNNFLESKISWSINLKKRFTRKSSLSSGINIDYYMLNLIDSVKRIDDIDLSDNINNDFRIVTDNKDEFLLFRAFSQWKYKFTDKLTLYTGVHFQHTNLNSDFAFEPRISLKWDISKRHSLNFGGGMHSMLQPHMVYFVNTELDNGNLIQTNKDLGFTKSDQAVISYNFFPGENFRIKVESYYQNLRNIPINEHYEWYSAVNDGAGFGIPSIDSLVNEGKGKNYGVELTIEKFYSKNYYFLITSSFYESKYTAYDNIERNTAFNGNYVLNGLFGYEFKIGKNNSLAVNLKGVYAGGKRKVPIDLDESIIKKEEVIIYSELYKDRYDDYVKADLRISFKLNRKKTSHEWALDLQNVTNNKNIFQQFYNPAEETIQSDYQTGFYPMMLYRFRF